MKILWSILKVILFIAGVFLFLMAAYTYLLESSPMHSADYFGLVFTMGCGIPGIILLTLTILSFKHRKIFFKIFGILFLLIFALSMPSLFKVQSYMLGSIFVFDVSWVVAGFGYIYMVIHLNKCDQLKELGRDQIK